jgi:hypothetical protein
MVIVRIILGLMIITGCIAAMKYVVRLVDITGKTDFAEKYLPYPLAGTYSFYRLVAFFIIALTLMWMLGYFKFLPLG